MQKESIGDQHHFTVVPVLSSELNVSKIAGLRSGSPPSNANRAGKSR